MLVNWKAAIEAGNASISNGTMTKSIDTMIEQLKPEAAYFFANDGRRGGFMIFDMADTSQIPQIAEPLFQVFHAEVEFTPVMNHDDLQRALASVG
jgi:hypothetical protein